MKFFNWFKPKVKSIAFLDGDQDLIKILKVHADRLMGIECHLIRQIGGNIGDPNRLKNVKNINKIYLRGYTKGKETVDKYIAAAIQKAIMDGYTKITVVSDDYDFIDIFKMSAVLNPEIENISFTLIIPTAMGRVVDVPSRIFGIEVIKL